MTTQQYLEKQKAEKMNCQQLASAYGITYGKTWGTATGRAHVQQVFVGKKCHEGGTGTSTTTSPSDSTTTTPSGKTTTQAAPAKDNTKMIIGLTVAGVVLAGLTFYLIKKYKK